MKKKEREDMTPATEIKKPSLQSLIESGKVKVFQTDDEGRVLLNPDDPDDLEWFED
ncbi:hypothetical protein [Geobacillus sp. Y412MC52]|uniref:hypothetical protein n=1 Tax=Geobacillus sp. (strain Y412MC52) TaxID=550542 RepID=UPI00018C1B33|nr:hypothetical protein [Geobacillus sp. Y412MC52]ADU92852.1 hypothetical protein GYMC52_0349 [Geobacillus sp. Y412MC52]